MKKIFLLVIAVFLLQTAAHAEVIHYAIMQMGIKAGQADLTWVGPVNYKGKDLLLVTFKADGFNFYDEEKIYLDPAAYKPFIVERDLNIMGKKEKITEEYHTDKGEILITKIAGGKTTQQVLQKAGVVDNIYGFIFRYRKSGSFKIGDEIDIILPTTDLKISLDKETKIQAGGKTYDSFYMQSKPSKYKLWFDKSDKKIPLRINGAVGIGNTVMVMTDYKE